jgi:hypothetical protein
MIKLSSAVTPSVTPSVLGKALFALDAAVKFKSDADVGDDEFHRLIGDLEERVGKLPVIDDGAGCFEAPIVCPMSDRPTSTRPPCALAKATSD